VGICLQMQDYSKWLCINILSACMCCFGSVIDLMQLLKCRHTDYVHMHAGQSGNLVVGDSRLENATYSIPEVLQ